ncbi:MAG TPA: hypothetical protein VGM37_14015 [Armatimonadota bacterium]|jgi:hypothetical protein
MHADLFTLKPFSFFEQVWLLQTVAGAMVWWLAVTVVAVIHKRLGPGGAALAFLAFGIAAASHERAPYEGLGRWVDVAVLTCLALTAFVAFRLMKPSWERRLAALAPIWIGLVLLYSSFQVAKAFAFPLGGEKARSIAAANAIRLLSGSAPNARLIRPPESAGYWAPGNVHSFACRYVSAPGRSPEAIVISIDRYGSADTPPT